jgi:four helix bundle protein
MTDARVKTFRDLKAWQRSMELARRVYLATRKLPDSERYGLASQMRRAAVSVPSNIAEGYGRQNRPDYLRFLRVARGSVGELSTQAELAASLGLMPMDTRLMELVEEVDRVLQGLIRSLERKQRGET